MVRGNEALNFLGSKALALWKSCHCVSPFPTSLDCTISFISFHPTKIPSLILSKSFFTREGHKVGWPGIKNTILSITLPPRDIFFYVALTLKNRKCVSYFPEVVYFWRIRYRCCNIFVESEQHSFFFHVASFSSSLSSLFNLLLPFFSIVTFS